MREYSGQVFFVLLSLLFPSTIDDVALLPIPPHYSVLKEVREPGAWE